MKMNDFDQEDVSMPVSPMADYLSSSVINVFILGVLESEVPIDDSRAVPLLEEAFLPINPRFSSIMVNLAKWINIVNLNLSLNSNISDMYIIIIQYVHIL